MALLSKKTNNLIIIALSAAIVLAFLWNYSETGAPAMPAQIAPSNHQTDFYLRSATIRQYDTQGQLDSTLYSDTVDHYPGRSLAELSKPVVKFYKDGQLSWTITSLSGIVYDGGDQVNFSQRVVINSDDQQAILMTPFLTAYPNRRFAETDKPVTLLNPKGFTRAIGMTANLEHKQINLLNQVRGQYNAVPQP